MKAHVTSRIAAFLLVALAMLSGHTAVSAANLTNLRCEYLADPLGIDVAKPRLSWVIESAQRGERQTAYQVMVASTPEFLAKDQGDLWDSGKVASEQSIQVEYAGKPLESRLHCHWKVRIWDQDGKATGWSKPANWSMGLLKPDDWQAKWIKPDVAAPRQHGLDHCSWIWFPQAGGFDRTPPGTAYFRARLLLPADAVVRHASLVMCADNSFALFVNGKEALKGDDWHVPQKTEITGLLKAGENILAVAANNADIGPNWAGLIGRVTVELADGRQVALETGPAWKTQNRELTGWPEAAFDDAGWSAAQEVAKFGAAPWGQLTGQLKGRIGGQFHPWLRRTFAVTSAIKRADIYVNTPGNYELYVNGKRVGEDVLAPAYSDFRKRMFYTVHDVAGLLRKGTNCIALWLGPGWYQPGYGNPYNSVIVRAQLEMETTNGRHVIGTDALWRSSDSCISQVGTWSWNAMGGEKWDAANYIADWNLAGFDDRAWALAVEVSAPKATTSWLAMPGNRAGKPIPPARIYPVNNKWVIDFGTTLTGWMRLKLADLKPEMDPEIRTIS
jgi:alpha-L-rhamnosidase